MTNTDGPRAKVGQLVFATANPHKVAEVEAKLQAEGVQQYLPALRIVGLPDIGCSEELPESTGTIPGNALQKARFVRDKYAVDVFAEDSGLEVDALHGAPGVDTAHYSGHRDDAANMARVLAEMRDVATPAERSARFRAVIALCLRDGRERLFEGEVEGHIAFAKTGAGGFGYDPIFVPAGYTHSFAELPAEVKLGISHRARAVEQLADFLRQDGGSWA